MKFWKIFLQKFCAGFLATILIVYPLLPTLVLAQEVTNITEVSPTPSPSETNQANSQDLQNTTVDNTNDADIANNLDTSSNTGDNQINPSPSPTPDALSEVINEETLNVSPTPEIDASPSPSLEPVIDLNTDNATDSGNPATASGELTNALSETGSGSSAQNLDTPQNSTSTATSTNTTSEAISNDNQADVLNKLDNTSNTGNNTFDLGTVLETGTASANLDNTNVINTNLVGTDFLYSLINLLTASEGDLDLSQLGNNSLISQEMISVIANNQATGKGSVNLALAAILSQIAIYNQNQAQLTNNLCVGAVSGQNNLTGDNSSLNTGDANAQVNLFNMVNTNLTGSDWFFGVINLFQQLNGDIYLPNEFAFLNSLSPTNLSNTLALNSNTGDNSTNSAIATSLNTIQINNNNSANILNNVDVTANSGNNLLNGQGAINTGDAQASASLTNMVNTNITGSNWVMIIIQNFGTWTGSLQGWWGSFLQIGNTAFAWVQLPDSESLNNQNVISTNGNTGDNSINQSLASSNQLLTVNNQNQANITNNISVLADTGNNSASGNNTEINSGNALANANILNFVNTNIFGNHWYFVMINIFDKFLGNIFIARPDVTLTMSANKSDVKVGDTISFNLTYKNTGKYLANGIKIINTIPQGTSFESASNGGQAQGNQIIWDLNNLNESDQGTVTLALKINDSSNKSFFTNLAQIETSSFESDAQNNQASIDVNILEGSTSSSNENNQPNDCSDKAPQSAPQLISAIAGENSVTLTWEPAQNPVTYYLVAYGRTPGVWEYGNPNVGDSGTRSYTVNELSGGTTTYYFTVRAGNGCATGPYAGTLSAIPWGKQFVGAAQGFTSSVLGAETQIETSPNPLTAQAGQPQVLGDTTSQKPVCWWWLISSVLALVITSATLAIWGSHKPKYWWLLPIGLTLAVFLGDQYLAHKFFEASKYCNWMWLWSVLATLLPTIVFTKLQS